MIRIIHCADLHLDSPMETHMTNEQSSCRFCQQILVLDQGRVIQEGNHGALVNQEGMYRTLWQAQAQFYES